MSDSTKDAPHNSAPDSRGSRWLLAAIVMIILALAGYWLLGGALPSSSEQNGLEDILPIEAIQTGS